ncbi:septal ring lytic transglycosylase RlpA family protein [Paramagnetospirillum magneticum]|uniref:Endolytic peptidoglycan transglycosylase RlpA n=1 Tax=Paramagnetospirillum magneticum (strain ATCC 700264 / AMB-1) TaxID=342108 RepID=Q2W4G9_PARM1|nr:septal ring lytic transglycosylase RlpA family protein [Paramagnetospirillum magneticum]BAE51256.1 Lipoprotein [Paramagnetospirillum magneticum AMB-1]
MSRRTRLAALLLSGTVLTGCAEMNLFGHLAKSAVGGDEPPPPSASASTNYKVGKPYQVAGVWYYPQEDFAYDETGIASWYGPNFHAKLTANGETFDQNAVTAAHKTLQMPSVARVTNLENGRSIIVRINDRGPFVNGRILDLSRRSAQLLGMEGRGTAKVRVQILPEESRVLAGKLKPDNAGNEPKVASAAPRGSVSAESLPPPPGVKNNGGDNVTIASSVQPKRSGMTPESVEREVAAQEVKSVPVRPTSIYVQAGSYGRHDNANRMVARLSKVGKAQLQQVHVQGKTLFRVRLGPMTSVEEADRVLDSVVATGAEDARVVVD